VTQWLKENLKVMTMMRSRIKWRIWKTTLRIRRMVLKVRNLLSKSDLEKVVT
jgi:hypothetical protein